MPNSGFNVDYGQLAHTYTRIVTLFLTVSVGGFAFMIQQGLQDTEFVLLDVWTLLYFGGMMLCLGTSLGAFLYVRDPRAKFSPSKIINVGVIIFFIGLGFVSSYIIYLVDVVIHDEILINLMIVGSGVVLFGFLISYFIFLGRHKIE